MLKKNIVLIDYESVQPEALACLEPEHFSLFIFVGASQAKVSVNLAIAVQGMGDRARYIQISGNGPNALDFHIAFYMGQLALAEPTAMFHVISKDKGFDPLIQHLKSKKIAAARSSSLESMCSGPLAAAQSASERATAFALRLQESKGGRPRTTKTLSRSIQSFFQNHLSETAVLDVLEALQAMGFVQKVDDRVMYADQQDPLGAQTSLLTESLPDEQVPTTL
jgi:hypothetical protein